MQTYAAHLRKNHKSAQSCFFQRKQRSYEFHAKQSNSIEKKKVLTNKLAVLRDSETSLKNIVPTPLLIILQLPLQFPSKNEDQVKPDAEE